MSIATTRLAPALLTLGVLTSAAMGAAFQLLPVATRQPLRAVLDSGLRMPLSAGMLALPGTTVVYCADDGNRQSLVDAGCTQPLNRPADHKPLQSGG